MADVPLRWTMTETCVACPTQYDVVLDDGRLLYFRYRFSRWQLHLGGPSGPKVEGRLEDRDDMDGMLESWEVVDLLSRAVPELLELGDRG